MEKVYSTILNISVRFGNIVWIILIFINIIPTGCTAVSSNADFTLKKQAVIQPQMGWWRVAFKMNWPPETTPLWYMDLLLAHQIIYPVLKDHNSQIALWRFHRRAGKDSAGHQFSFIFYSTPESAAKINSQIKSTQLLTSLEHSGELKHFHLQSTDHIIDGAIEATSDPGWSVPMQKAWPYYIMGVSQMWLSLIDQYVIDIQSVDASVEDLQDLYKKVNAKMIETWQDEGHHALFHHLNALFGYHPLWLKLRF